MLLESVERLFSSLCLYSWANAITPDQTCWSSTSQCVTVQAAFALAAGSELKTSNMTQMDTEKYLEREEIVKKHIYIEELM